MNPSDTPSAKAKLAEWKKGGWASPKAWLFGQSWQSDVGTGFIRVVRFEDAEAALEAPTCGLGDLNCP